MFQMFILFIVANDTPVLVHITLPEVHGIHNDTLAKGIHIKTSNGIDLTVTGGGNKIIKFSPAFSRDAGTSAYIQALNDAKLRAK